MNIYIAAPLFNEMELSRNLQMDAFLKGLGHTTFLPQRDAGEAYEGKPRQEIFAADFAGMEKCDLCVACVDGATVDEGTCFEIGYLFALNKPIILHTTERRSFMGGHPNVMLEFAGYWARTQQDLIQLLEKLAKDKERAEEEGNDEAN